MAKKEFIETFLKVGEYTKINPQEVIREFKKS